MHMDPPAFAQPWGTDESIRCAQLEGQTWQRVTLVRTTGEMMGGQRHPPFGRKSLSKDKLEAPFLC